MLYLAKGTMIKGRENRPFLVCHQIDIKHIHECSFGYLLFYIKQLKKEGKKHD